MMKLLIYGYVVLSAWGMSSVMADHDGLYLPLGSEDCYYKVMKYKGKEFCVPETPLIPVDNFKKIGALRSAGKIDFFDVDIDKQGTQKLYLLQETLKGLDLAFIMNNEIIGLIELDDKNSSHQIRFYSLGFDEPLKEVHDHLEAILKKKKN